MKGESIIGVRGVKVGSDNTQFEAKSISSEMSKLLRVICKECKVGVVSLQESSKILCKLLFICYKEVVRPMEVYY